MDHSSCRQLVTLYWQSHNATGMPHSTAIYPGQKTVAWNETIHSHIANSAYNFFMTQNNTISRCHHPLLNWHKIIKMSKHHHFLWQTTSWNCASHLFAKPLKCWLIIYQTLKKKKNPEILQTKHNKFHSRNDFKNVVCKMQAIWSQSLHVIIHRASFIANTTLKHWWPTLWMHKCVDKLQRVNYELLYNHHYIGLIWV